jgi:outer membrane protein assembly factor BamB
LFVGSCSGNFYALDKDTGKLRWSYNIHRDGDQTSFHGDPLITSDSVIIGTDAGKQGHIYAFDQATGRVRWKYLVTTGCNGDFGVASDIVRKGDAIYAVAQGDDLLCLDLATGRLRWHFASRFDRGKFEWANSPALRGNIVFFDGHDGFVYALDAASGELIWKSDLHSPVITSPVLVGNSIYAGTSGHFYRLRAKDGKQLSAIAISSEPWRNVTVNHETLFATPDKVAKRQDDLLALNLAAQRIQWIVKPPSPKWGWSTAWPYLWHHEILASDKGHLYAYRETDGSLAWSHAFPGRIVRGIGVTPSILYLGTFHGMLYAFVPPRN